jgi:hypothetical protein
MRRRFTVACALCLTFAAAPLLAQPSPTELAVARQLFDEAVELEAASDWKEARGKLAEAAAIKETPGLHFHLGHCAEQLGDDENALKAYDRALELVRDGMHTPDVERLLPSARARVLERLALKKPARAPKQVPKPPAEAPPTASGTAAERDASAKLGPRELVLIGESSVALAGLGVGIGFLIAQSNARGRVQAAQEGVDELPAANSAPCATPGTTARAACDELGAAIADHDRARLLSTVGFVSAGVGAVATVVTFAVWKSDERPAVSVGPGPGVAGLALRGAF